MNTWHDRLQHALTARNLDWIDLVKATGLSKPSVYAWKPAATKRTKVLDANNAAVVCSFLKINIEWLMNNRGESGLSPSSDTQNGLIQPESSHDKDKESAVLLKFPKTLHSVIENTENYFIPQYAAGGSMGNGLTLPDQPGVIENWSVSREWMQKNVRNITGVQNLCIVTGFGPSMQPMYNPGDPLLVDTGVKQVIADGVYFFRVGENGYIKQLQMIPTETGVKYVAKSKNPDFDPFDITEAMDFEILGKVVRVWCGTDF